MNIDWTIPCHYAEVNDNLGTLVGAGADKVYVQDFPAPVHVMMAIRLLAMAEELGPERSHVIRSVLKDPSGAGIGEVEMEFRADVQDVRTDWLNGLTLVYRGGV